MGDRATGANGSGAAARGGGSAASRGGRWWNVPRGGDRTQRGVRDRRGGTITHSLGESGRGPAHPALDSRPRRVFLARACVGPLRDLHTARNRSFTAPGRRGASCALPRAAHTAFKGQSIGRGRGGPGTRKLRVGR